MFFKKFERRDLLKTSAYGVALSALPQISLAQSYHNVVVVKIKSLIYMPVTLYMNSFFYLI